VRFSIGRALELVGIVLVGVGLAIGLVRDDLRYEERMFFAGCGVFLVGWLIARPARIP
jgi:uncharacterized membrane protein YhhN